MNKRYIWGLLFFLIFLLLPKKTSAYVYGVEVPTTQIIVDKKVRSVLNNQWFDNLAADQTVFAAESLIEFKIIVKNTGDKELKNIKLIDYLPEYLNTVFYPGDFNKDNRQISWSFEKLNPGEEKESRIRVQVVKSNQLPNNGRFCLVNKVEAKTEEGLSDGDTAQFCLETRVLAQKLPEAGGNIALATLITSLIASLGIIARKFGRGEIIN